jgi:hypothetical protein
MVNQATVQAKVDAGFAKAAAAIGVSCQWYRPTGPTNPLAASNLLGTLQVLFDTNASLAQRSPRQRQKPEEWYAAFDTTGVSIGDYLVTPTPETLFITAMDPFRPARSVLTNQIVDIHAPGTMEGIGLVPGYGGDIRPSETVVASGWPASLISGPRREAGDAKLPGDVKLPWEALLLPAIPGATLRNNMIVLYTTTNGTFRLILSAVDLTSLGYSCTAVLETD